MASASRHRVEMRERLVVKELADVGVLPPYHDTFLCTHLHTSTIDGRPIDLIASESGEKIAEVLGFIMLGIRLGATRERLAKG